MRRLKCNNSKSYANYFGGLGFYYSKFLISREQRERERDTSFIFQIYPAVLRIRSILIRSGMDPDPRIRFIERGIRNRPKIEKY